MLTTLDGEIYLTDFPGGGTHFTYDTKRLGPD